MTYTLKLDWRFTRARTIADVLERYRSTRSLSGDLTASLPLDRSGDTAAGPHGETTFKVNWSWDEIAKVRGVLSAESARLTSAMIDARDNKPGRRGARRGAHGSLQ